MIYVSTGGRNDLAASDYADQLIGHGIYGIELSGGAYKKNELECIMKLSKSSNLVLHNYYPPPKTPFVLNVATPNVDLARESIAHIRKALEWSSYIGAKFYSLHAGYLIDPGAGELGGAIKSRKINDRKSSINLFIERITELSFFAEKLNVDILIENNVINRYNFKRFGVDPLMMTTAEECVYVMEKTPPNVSLLVDLAHVKVSSRTLNYCPIKFLEKCGPWIKGYHISDNDGEYDTNSCVQRDSWFWPYIIKTGCHYTLEVYTDSIQELRDQLSLSKEFIEA